jgi:hypothetical protein
MVGIPFCFHCQKFIFWLITILGEQTEVVQSIRKDNRKFFPFSASTRRLKSAISRFFHPENSLFSTPPAW